MRKTVIILSLCAMASVASFAQERETRWVRDYYDELPEDTLVVDVKADSLYQLLTKGTMAEVYIEKAVYHTAFDDFYYLKFCLKNISNQTIGVYLDDVKNLFYPHFYNFTRYHYFNDESKGEPIYSEYDYEQIKKWFYEQLKEHNENHRLKLIKPHEQYTYYRNFNERKQQENFDKPSYELGICLEGQLFFTNGEEVDLHRLDNKEETRNERTIIFPCPIIQKQICSKLKNSMILSVEDVTRYY